MQLPLQTFTDLVQGMAAAVQAAATQLLDVAVGSTLRAILEANASIGLWIQWLVVQVLQMTRAATSAGGDLDSWMGDFSLTRLPATAASGMVTLSRFTTGAIALAPTGALVRTADATETFSIVTDSTNSNWDSTQLGYILGTGVTSIDVPVTALVAGTCGNVLAGTVSVLASPLPGIDTVANGAAFSNGVDAESDAAFRARFHNFISSRSRATPLAVGYAVTSIQQGLNYTIQENVDPSGMTRMGNFLVFVDDGSGYPPDSLISVIQEAIEAVRPVGSTFAVFPPCVTVVNVSMTLTVGIAAEKASAIATLVSAVSGYIDGLPLGTSLPVTKIAQLAYAASPNVTNVTGILLNGLALDIVLSPSGVVKVGTVVVS